MMLSLSEVLVPLIAVALVIGPLWLIVRGGLNRKNAKQRLLGQVALFAGVFAICLIVGGTKFAAMAEDATTASAASSATGLGYIAAALSVGCACIGAGWAVAKASPAAIGAISENPDNFGKAIIFVALGEGIAIYGLLISILILNNL